MSLPVRFRYHGDPGRYYPTLGLTADPGDVAEFDQPPDSRWSADPAESGPGRPPATPAARASTPDTVKED